MMNATISIGEIQVTVVSGGRMRLDGGNMFGVVPRVMWQRVSPPDELHRVLLDTNCMLVRTPDSLGLIDTGYGGKAAAKIRQRYALEDGTPLTRNLAAHGISPDEIDWVIFTHLHFDHAGGCTYRDESRRLRLTFPRARHFVQRNEWDDATGDLPELVGSYFADDFKPVADAGLLELVDGSAEIVPGVTTQLTGGHTRGHQIVTLQSSNESAVLPGDICPTTAHLETFWTMAYDQSLLDVRRVKPGILNDIVAHNRIALFSHDPHTPAARLARDADGRWRVTPLSAE
jgi:glyoxylase-like metal-dependent hydrolase (beta-lactamase superfamily II)